MGRLTQEEKDRRARERQEQRDAERASRLSIAELKDRGWTESLVRKHLRDPDYTCANPHYHSAAPMRFYARARVEAVEASKEWAHVKASVAIRREAGLRAAERRRRETLAWVNSLTISVPVMPIRKLLDRACAHYNDMMEIRILERGDYDREWSKATRRSSREFLERICTNYLRHQMTDYESLLRRKFGRVGADEAYEAIKTKVNEAIYDAYPSLGW